MDGRVRRAEREGDAERLRVERRRARLCLRCGERAPRPIGFGICAPCEQTGILQAAARIAARVGARREAVLLQAYWSGSGERTRQTGSDTTGSLPIHMLQHMQP